MYYKRYGYAIIKSKIMFRLQNRGFMIYSIRFIILVILSL
uniref:Uncharacterized protein n=1 Tax=Arundo donax TaxID=35708 RepID=A0A0A9AYX4_ARUDO